jgi:hypothetical protein
MCGSSRSISLRKNPPAKKPSTEGKGLPSLSSMAGARRLQKLAAIITPAAKPRSVSSTDCRIVLKNSTKLEPKAVINQVKRVPKKARNIGYQTYSSPYLYINS